MEQFVVVIALVASLTAVSNAQTDWLSTFSNIGSGFFNGPSSKGSVLGQIFGGGGGGNPVRSLGSKAAGGAGGAGGPGGAGGAGGAGDRAAKIISSFVGSANGGDGGGGGGGEGEGAVKAIDSLIGSGTEGGEAAGGGGGDPISGLLRGIGLENFGSLFGGGSGGGSGGGDPLSSLLGGGGNPFSNFLGSGNPDPFAGGNNNDLLAQLLGAVGKGTGKEGGGSPLDILGSLIGPSDTFATSGTAGGSAGPLENVDLGQVLAGGLLSSGNNIQD